MADAKYAYECLTDEALIEEIRNGDEDAQDFLLNKYKNLVKIKARAYFLIGADNEDIIQEGMIGLYKAVRDYDENKQTSFKVFADVCITRQIITAIKSATRQKHIPLNSYVSLNKQVFREESERTYLDMLAENSVSNPEDLFIGRENKNFIESNMYEQLSEFESKVLKLYLQGKSYFEIASVTNKQAKSIDNALQRVKRKVEKIISSQKAN